MRRGLGVILLLGLTACYDPVAGALVINDLGEPVTVSVAGVDAGPWVIEPGKDDIPVAPPGDQKFQFAAGEKRWEKVVHLTGTELILFPASEDGCIALSDHLDQYGGAGTIQVMAKAGPGKPGKISLDGELYLGVDDPLPKEIYPGTPVRRFTRVDCALLDDDKALKAHLWGRD